MREEAALFKVLSDSTRLRLAVLLAAQGEVCVCHLATSLGEPNFKISRHLRVMRSAGIVEARREGTWMHYQLAAPRTRLEACLQECFRDCLKDHDTAVADGMRLRQATSAGAREGTIAAMDGRKANVLFLCTGNSCRSQMAEGWARAMWGDRMDAYSAGIETHGLNPNAVKVMAEAHIDISGHRSKRVDEVLEVPFDLVVTVCGHAHETCPMFPAGAKVIHVGFDDPPKLAEAVESEEARLACYRRVRDEIKAFVKTLPGLLGKSGPEARHAQSENTRSSDAINL